MDTTQPSEIKATFVNDPYSWQDALTDSIVPLIGSWPFLFSELLVIAFWFFLCVSGIFTSFDPNPLLTFFALIAMMLILLQVLLTAPLFFMSLDRHKTQLAQLDERFTQLSIEIDTQNDYIYQLDTRLCVMVEMMRDIHKNVVPLSPSSEESPAS